MEECQKQDQGKLCSPRLTRFDVWSAEHPIAKVACIVSHS